MRSSIVAAAAVASMVLAVPAVAGAASVYVSNSSPVGSGRSCASPGYATIQSAIEAVSANTAVKVCGGTYSEQLEITKGVKLQLASGSGTVRVAMPATPANSKTTCDTEGGLEQRDEISICTSETVSITGLTVEAEIPLETCAGGLYDIFVGGGATLKATSDDIVGASTTVNADKGCQHGVALEVGLKTPVEVGHATLKNVNVSGYEKNGPTVKAAGSSLAILNSTVTGEGPSPYIAQNGVQISYGATGTIKNTMVSGNECEESGVCSATGEQASGVLFYGAAAGSSVKSSKIEQNDIGGAYVSLSPTEPSSPEVKFVSTVFQSDRYEGVLLEQGKASLTKDTIDGTALYGLAINQYSGQPYAPGGEAKGCTIEGMSTAGVVVFSDKEPGDPPGSFKLSTSSNSIEHNATPVINESNNYTITN